MSQRAVLFFRFGVDQHGMALVEGAALGILSGKTNRISFQQQRTKRQCFRESIVDRALAMPHLGALLEQLGDFRVHVKALWHPNDGVCDLGQLFTAQAGIRFIFGLETAAMVGRPILR